MKDAIRRNTCADCLHNHQPNEKVTGVCVKYPPTAFVVGFQPVGGILVDPSKAGMAQTQPIVHGYYPPAILGCSEWEHEGAAKLSS